MPEISIKEGSLEQALEVLAGLPEFDALKPLAHYETELNKANSLILVAWAGDMAVGCKIGYDRFQDGSFYSWLGGVLPDYRKLGVAKQLADHQEAWAIAAGYQSIKFKTQNRHRAMLQFALRNGFAIYNVKPKEALANYRIELVKHLK